MLRRLSVVLVVPLAFALAGCAETVQGDGQIAEGASPTAEPTAAPTDGPTEEPTNSPTGGPTDGPTDEPTDPGGGGDQGPPANADQGETWGYTDGLDMTVAVKPYDGGEGIVLSDEFAVLMTYHFVNNSDVPVELNGDGNLECQGGNAIDAYDSSLPDVTGTLQPGQSADFQQGWAIDNEAAGGTCTLEYTPGDNYFPALFQFTASPG